MTINEVLEKLIKEDEESFIRIAGLKNFTDEEYVYDLLYTRFFYFKEEYIEYFIKRFRESILNIDKIKPLFLKTMDLFKIDDKSIEGLNLVEVKTYIDKRMLFVIGKGEFTIPQGMIDDISKIVYPIIDEIENKML